jgi:hypothetical protein
MRSGLFTFVVLLCGLVMSACHKQTVEPLKNPAQLRADAMKMLKDLPVGDVPKAHWPESIKALKPLSVTREADDVKILVAQERGKFSVGYQVFRDGQRRPSTQGVWIEKTGFEGVYIYKTQY